MQLRKLAALQVATAAANNNNNSRGPKRSKKSPVPNAPGANDLWVTRLHGTSQIAAKTMPVATTTRK